MCYSRTMRSPIYTLEEIQSGPEFGGEVGWFYGLVKHHETGKVGLYEIFPGLGYANAFPLWSKAEERPITGLPRTLWIILKDIYWAVKR